MNNQEKDCDTCKHEGKDFRREEPCKSCIDALELNGVPLFWEEANEDE